LPHRAQRQHLRADRALPSSADWCFHSPRASCDDPHSVGIIVGQGDRITPWRGFSLAFTYVQGMALTYAAAGAVFAALFKTAPQANVPAALDPDHVALLFVALAFAMFGTYTLQLPSALQTRLTNLSNGRRRVLTSARLLWAPPH